ncbi:MAG TPA: hypothetical protein VGX51_13395 [Solirubrobacteraceae bacterium]|jgi:hypothetical protein|nr:hypothetical protein [Solirubrobacteraceae bacterium]
MSRCASRGKLDGPSVEERGLLLLAMFTPVAISAGGIAGFGILYVLLFLFLGIRSLKRGHWIMFLIGIPIPLFWIIGALSPPVR